jgi:hypothetical protein
VEREEWKRERERERERERGERERERERGRERDASQLVKRYICIYIRDIYSCDVCTLEGERNVAACRGREVTAAAGACGGCGGVV